MAVAYDSNGPEGSFVSRTGGSEKLAQSMATLARMAPIRAQPGTKKPGRRERAEDFIYPRPRNIEIRDPDNVSYRHGEDAEIVLGTNRIGLTAREFVDLTFAMTDYLNKNRLLLDKSKAPFEER